VEWGTCGGAAVTAGPGIVVEGTTIRVDGGVVPQFTTSTATLTGWATIAAQSCVEKNMAHPGASGGEAIAAGWPPDMANGLTGTMYATAGGTVVVRICNATAAAVAGPEGKTFRATILRSF
jgi:hypothetical protein